MNKPYVAQFHGKTICRLCGRDEELRLGVCFECASAQEIIGEQILKEPKPIKTNEILKTLANKGYFIVDKNFLERARQAGIKSE